MRNTVATKSTTSSKTIKKTAPKTLATATKKTTPVKKTLAKPNATMAKAIKTPTTALKTTPATKAIVTSFTPEQRHAMITVAAYYIAEKNGFNPNHSADYWIEAEKEIDASLLA